MVELKPCPFCGTKVTRIKGLGGLIFFKCLKGTCGAVVSFDNDYCNTNKNEADEAWNRRVADES